MNKQFKHHKYTLDYSFGTMRHNWQVVGHDGAINFHAGVADDGRYETTAGLEFHHLQGEGAPDHVNCQLTGGRCWHDGTSLYATESVWPVVESYLRTGEQQKIFGILEGEYCAHFGPPVSEDGIGSTVSKQKEDLG